MIRFLHGVEHDFGGVVQIELLHQIRAMGLDRGDADIEQRGDFFVRATFRQQLQDFLFTIGQQVIGVGQPASLQLPHVVFDQHAGDGRAEERLSAGDRAKRRHQIFVGRILQQVRACAGGQRTNDVGLVGVHAQDDHARRAGQLLDSLGDLDAVHLRHRRHPE